MKTFKFTKLALALAFASGTVVACDSDYKTTAVKTDSATKTSIQGDFVVAKFDQSATATYQLAQADMDNEPTATDRYGVDNEEQESTESETYTSRPESDSTESQWDAEEAESQWDSGEDSEELGLSSNADQTVQFEFDSDELSDDAKDQLKDFVENMEQQDLSSVKVSIKGYTDEHGPEEYNKDLAERRAESVKSFLEEEGLSSDNLEVEAIGVPEEDALADNARENRRVDISVEAPSQEDEIS